MLKFFLLVFLVSCGPTHYDHPVVNNQPTDNGNLDTQTQIDTIKQAILALQGSQAQIDALVNSDFSTCPTSGATANQLINTMCKVAQYATNESKVELQGQLSAYSKLLSGQIQAVNDSLATAIDTESTDITTLNTSLTAINGSITSINTSISTLNGQMTSANAAIAALQATVNGAIGAINGAMGTVSIGTENLFAGPIYEAVLRSTDMSKINAYVEASSAAVSLGSNSLTATNGSNSIKITLATHGFTVGDNIYLTGLVGTKGFTNEDVYGLFLVATVVDASNFTIIAARNANSTGAFGGVNGKVQKITGRGLATVWQTASGADAAVRVATSGTKPYNFIIKATGQVCYSKTDNLATFATIIANGTSIVCK